MAPATVSGHLARLVDGKVLVERPVEVGWVTCGQRRVVRTTDAGRVGLTEQLGVASDIIRG